MISALRLRNRVSPITALSYLGLCWVILLVSPTSLHAAEPPPLPFELQPYRVRISVAFSESPDLDPALRESILSAMPDAADRLLGEMWSVKTDENNWLFPTTAEYLTELTPDSLPADWIKDSYDKSYLILLEQAGGEYVLTGREWDQVGRVLGSPLSRKVIQRRELAAATFRLAHDLFRPRLQVERITDGVAAVTVQGGALAPADPSCIQLRKGQFWQPYLRYRNPQGEVEKLQAVPWTMLEVQDINPDSRAHGQAKVVSGLRSALPSRRRPRIDVFARAMEPTVPETELRLISRQLPARPLVGMVVDARTKPDVPPTRFMTDRNGAVRIPARKTDPLLWLYVRSGEKILAKLPLVPGLEEQVTAELPDDSLRLRVEGELSILQSNLTDTVAQRAVLIARIRRLVQLGDWKSAKELQRDLRALPTPDNYLRDLNAIRIPALQAAQAAKDKPAAGYIQRVCEECSKIIQKYLDDEKLKAFEDELKELQRLGPGVPKAAPKAEPKQESAAAPKLEPKAEPKEVPKAETKKAS